MRTEKGSAMESKATHAWEQKRMFIVMSVLFLVYWLMYLAHLVKTWPSMDPRMHLDSSSLATFSFGLLMILLREKASGWAMMFATFAFIAAANLVLHMF
jgi:hypothetical protein